MHRFIGAAIAAAAVAGFASAASAAPVAAYNWTGFYIGANAGYAWNDVDLASRFTCPTGACPYTSQTHLDFIGALGSGSFSPNVFTGGGQVGYNFQNGPFVYGVELDIQSFHLSRRIDGGRLVPASGGQTAEVSASVDTNWLFTARPRIGWLVQPQLLLYVTGGLALTKIDVANSVSDNCAAVQTCGLPDLAGASSASKTKAGWTLGGGTEWAFSPQWSVKAEYLYVSFGDVSTTSATNLSLSPNPNIMKTSASINASIARIGVNFRF